MTDPSRTAEAGQIVVEILDGSATGLRIDTFVSYRFSESFVQPSDSWTFTIGDDSVTQVLIAKVSPGARVQMSIDGHITSTGIVDSVTVNSSRDGGTEVTIAGRDWLAPAVDSCIDPFTTKFNAGQTLFDVVSKALAPFGVSTFSADNDVNKNVITGQVRGKPTSKKGKPLKSFTVHQLKPYPQEGAYQFATRIADRFGLWIWPAADASFVIVGQPDFDESPPRFSIVHKINAAGANNNVMTSEVTRDATDQPSCIVACGESTGGEVERAKYQVIVMNELVAADATGAILPSISAILSSPAHKNARVVPLRADFATGVAFQGITAKPQYLYDNESKSLDQLEHFAKREMAMRQHRALLAHYSFEGHTNNGQPWCVDAIVSVDDDYANIHGPLWVLERVFSKSRGEGTRTDVTCCLPHTLVL